ncbi:hypothetical protein AAOGI_41240 [Agarivorans albus]
MKKWMLLTICIFPFLGYAKGYSNNYKVVEVRADASGKAYVKFDKPLIQTPAACGSGYASHLAFDLKTPGGQGILSVVLAAQASGKRIKAQGTGTCSVYGVIESWSWGLVNN